ncbi:MAG: insulinase family protein, partial [candidate division Zixibacteria bacterium]|nr:insulinase family protein [candidate division Zixibacteria bacterium]
MITSIVFVNAGARYEDELTNGATHFLEHLLFNGTRKYTQEELDDLTERHGGYINAFTRKDLTAFLVLMPKQFIDYGLEAQSEQLFHSILPEDRFAKERKIVIEEIRMGDDNPAYLVDKFHNSIVYAGTPYARPVLGYEQLITSIPRQEIVDYYQSWYAPNNMVALVIGDFETEEFIGRYETYYGTPPKKKVPTVPVCEVRIPPQKKIVRRQMDTKQCYLTFTSPAPLYSDPDYYPVYILNELLNNESTSPLLVALQSGDSPLASSVYTDITTQRDFSLFNVSINCSEADAVDEIIALVDQTMEKMIADWQPQQADIDAIIVSEKTSEIYLREKLHFYGFMVAPLMVATGYDFIDNLTANLEKVKAADVRRVVQEYFGEYNYVATVVTPKSIAAAVGETGLQSDYLQRNLPNGLEVVIKSNPYSQVQAFMVLGKDRTAGEPEGKGGITDFVNRMLSKGTANYSKEKLERKLQTIGANLTVHDNPYIPYDDRYTSRRFSFVKFETISEFTDDGIALLAEMIINPTFPESEVEKVRGRMMQVLGMKSGSTYQQARDLFYQLMFAGSPYSRPITGTRRSIGTITAVDLTEHHRRFYAPNNLILSVVTNLDPEVMYQKITDAFGGMEPADFFKTEITPPVAANGEVTENMPMKKKQAYLYLGGAACAASDTDAVSLRVAVDILSSRLAENLREKEGLAYRVGAGVTFDRNFGWFAASMGTGTENFARAKTGMLAEMEKMKNEPVTPEELELAVNSIWGSMLTARLSRINQAFYMAVSLFTGRGYNYEDDFLALLQQVTIEDVSRVAGKYFDTENYILATVGAPQL